VTTLTLTDASTEMLKVITDRYKSSSAKSNQLPSAVTTEQGLSVNIVQASAETLQFPSNSFDTVVSTFTLCSIHQPNAALQEAIRVLKPGGKLILLEHGQSYFNWLNQLLDKNAQKHANHWGCYFNRDIQSLVLQNQKSDAPLSQGSNNLFSINSISRWHFGTTWMIELTKTTS
jgi:methyltransferase OMS1